MESRSPRVELASIRRPPSPFELLPRRLVLIGILAWWWPGPAPARAGGLVRSCEFAAIEAAVSGGGVVKIECSGTIVFSRTLRITADTLLDATGWDVTFDGEDSVRLLEVTGGAALTLQDLKLTRGAHLAPYDAATAAGANAQGGAVFIDEGRITAVNCTFRGNRVMGGNSPKSVAGGAGKGGAVHIRSGLAEFTACHFIENWANGGPIVGESTRTGGFGPAWGGAICLENGVLRVAGSTFDWNQAVGATAPIGGIESGGAAYGGAVYCGMGQLEISGSRFVGNAIRPGSAPRNRPAGATGGGALFLRADITNALLHATEFVSNSCYGGTAIFGNTDGRGGAVFNAGTLDCSRSSFRSNWAGYYGARAMGGALFSSGTLRLRDCLLAGNLALGGIGGSPAGDPGYAGLGGALYSERPAAVGGCTFVGNQATGGEGDSIPGHIFSHGGNGAGGAIHALDTLELSNSTFSSNSASGGPAFVRFDLRPGAGLGGALYLARGPFTGTHLTLAGNTAVGGTDIEGLLPQRGTALGDSLCMTNISIATLANSIVASSGTVGGCAGVLTTSRNNLSTDASCDFAAHAGWDNSDPRLGPLGDHGGPTPTLALLVGSPAIDAGDPAACLAADQRGVSRAYGTGCDLGAYEAMPLPAFAVERTAAGILRLWYQGTAARAAVLQESEDLTVWSAGTPIATDAQGWWSATMSVRPEPRFFRVR